MLRSSIILLISLLIASTLTSCLEPQQKIEQYQVREPTNEEMALVDQLLDEDEDRAFQAMVRLIAKGEDSVPALIEAVGGGDEELAIEAAVTLGGMGETAKSASFVLVEVIIDTPVYNTELYQRLRSVAVEALRGIGTDAVPALIYGLKGSSGPRRKMVLDLIDDLGEEAVDTVPALIEAIFAFPPRYDLGVINTLENIGPAAKDAVPALMIVLREGNKEERKYAAGAIGGIGSEARNAVPLLLGEVEKYGSEVEIEFIGALGRMGAHAHDANKTLLSILATGDDPTRTVAADALGRIGTDPEIVVPVLINVLNELIERETEPDYNSEVPYPYWFVNLDRSVIAALGAYGPDAADAAPMITDYLRRAETDERGYLVSNHKVGAAIYALGNIGADPDRGIESVRRFIQSEDIGLREVAIYSTGKFGPAASQLVDELITAMSDEDPGIRYNAAWALGEIGSGAVDALPRLKIVEDDTNNGVRLAAREAVGKIVGAYVSENMNEEDKLTDVRRYSVFPRS